MLKYLRLRLTVPENQVKFIVHVVPQKDGNEGALHLVLQTVKLLNGQKPLQVGVLESIDYPQFSAELIYRGR